MSQHCDIPSVQGHLAMPVTVQTLARCSQLSFQIFLPPCEPSETFPPSPLQVKNIWKLQQAVFFRSQLSGYMVKRAYML